MKRFSLILVVLLLVGSLTGCSSMEKSGLIDWRKGTTMETMEIQQKISVKLDADQLDEYIEDDAVTRLLTDFVIFIEGKIDQVNLEGSLNLYLESANAKGEGVILLTDLYFNHEEIHINGARLVEALNKLGLIDSDTQYKELQSVFKEKPYVSVIEEDFSFSEDKIREQFEQRIAIEQEVIGLMQEGYRFFQGELVAQKGDGYYIHVDQESLVRLIDSLMEYQEKYSGKIYSMYKAGQELAKEYGLLEVAEIKEYTRVEFEEMTQEWVKQWDEEARNEFMTVLNAKSYGQLEFELMHDKDYKKIFKQKLVVNLENSGVYLTVDSLAKEAKVEFNPINHYQLMGDVIPKVDAIVGEYNRVEENVESVLPSPETSPEINVPEKKPESNQGKIIVENYRIESGDVYITISDMVKIIDCSMGWDGKKNQGYMIKGERKIPVKSKQIDGQFYVNIEEIRKVGYAVDYSNNGNTVSIIKK